MNWIEELIKTYPQMFPGPRYNVSCGDGWRGIVTKLCADLHRIAPIRVVQIKEKFGGLRFYVDGVPPEVKDQVFDLIREAEASSFETCEKCGKPGSMTDTGWIKTLCQECEDAR